MKPQKQKPFASLIHRLDPAPLLLGLALLPLATLTPVWADSGAKAVPPATLLAAAKSVDAQAVILSVTGDCEYSEDGVTFSRLKAMKEGATLGVGVEEGAVKQLWGRTLNEHAVIRTGKNAQTDIFLTRTGTTVRLHADSEMKLEKLVHPGKDNSASGNTVLDLPRGRITVAVRTLVPGSTIEVKSATTRAVIGGGGSKGRYSISADSSPVADKDSDVPLKLVDDTGTKVIPPADKSLSKKDRPLPEDPSDTERTLLQADDFDTAPEPLEKR